VERTTHVGGHTSVMCVFANTTKKDKNQKSKKPQKHVKKKQNHVFCKHPRKKKHVNLKEQIMLFC
jgi:hypothetical protein